jgi:hypothetical protein
VARADLDRDVRKAEVRAKRPAPKKKAAPRGAGIAGVSTRVATRQTTPKQVVQRTKKTGRPAPKRAPVDPLWEIEEQYLRSKPKAQPKQREIQTGGPADLSRLELLNNNTPTSFMGGLVRNTARGALDMLTGLPAAGQLLGENAAAFNPVVGPLRFVPGLDAVDRYQNRVAGMDKRAGTAVAASYKHKYGPAFRGDLGTTASRIYDDPFGTALDVTGAYGLAGRAGNVAAKATRAVAPSSRAAANASRRLSIAPAVERQTWVDAENSARGAAGRPPVPFAPGEGTRFRQPKVYRSDANGATGTAVVDRAPYSANAITRGVQKRVDRARPRVQQRVERFATKQDGRAGSLRTAAERFTQEGRYQKHQGKQGGEIRYMAERRAEAMIAATPEYNQFNKAVRKLQKDKTPAGITAQGLGREELAVSLHLDDYVTPRGGLSPAQLRDRAVAKWEKELADLGGDHPNARLQIERIKQIPEEMLTLRGDSPAVQRIKTAVQAGRDLDRVNQARSVSAGVITEKTAQAARSRPTAVVLGDAEWLPTILKKMKAEGAGRKAVAARREREFEANPPTWRGKDGSERNWNQLRADLASADRKLKSSPYTARKITEGDDAGKWAIFHDGKEFPDRRRFQNRESAVRAAVAAATRKRDKARVRLRSVEKKAEKRIAQAPRQELVGDKAVYRPAVGSEKGRKGSMFRPSRGMSGPQKVKQSHGTRQRTGTYDMNPALLSHQARRAAGNVTGPMSSRALQDLIDTAAYKVAGKDGEILARGKRAYQAMVNNEDKVVLVNAASLKKALAKLDNLEDGKFLDNADVRMFYGKPNGKEWLEDIAESAVTDQYIAISRSAAEAWRESMAAPWKWLQKYDNALDLWKGGLLALSPRWYINNVIGLAFQYGIVAGGDVRSIFRAARSPEIKRAIAQKNPDVAVATLADELTSGIDAGKIENAGALMTTIRAGFKLNNRIEAGWRRAAYLNRAKKMMRDEGGKFRGMSDAEMAAAIDRMPESVARQIVRDVDFYIGEYGRYSPIERQLIKRVVPFYSWLRVIGRLTLGLPFKSPVRALAMAVLSKAGTAGINPNDYKLPAYARGSLSFGNVKVPTWSINPGQTVVPFLEGMGEGNMFGGVAKAGVGWMTPVAQVGLNQGFGLNNFGEGVFAPPGAGGTVQQFGRDPQEMNQVTGLPQDSKVRIPWSEAFIQSAIPGIAGPLRRALVGEETAYDTTTLQDLLGLTGKPRGEMFYKRTGKRSRRPTALNPLTSYFGVPSYVQDDKVVDSQYRKRLRDFEKAAAATERRKRKASR